MNGDRYFSAGYYAEAVVADGPWEAIFRFCGKHGFNPKDVRVSPSVRCHRYEYWCAAGKATRYYIPQPIDAAIVSRSE